MKTQGRGSWRKALTGRMWQREFTCCLSIRRRSVKGTSSPSGCVSETALSVFVSLLCKLCLSSCVLATGVVRSFANDQR
jgi:hypothetical protein